MHGNKPGTPDWETKSQNGPANMFQEDEDRIAQTGSTKERDNENDTLGNILNWAKIAKLHRPSYEISSATIFQKIENSQKLLDTQHMKVRPEPRPTAVYYKDVRRGPIVVLRRAYSESLPR